MRRFVLGVLVSLLLAGVAAAGEPITVGEVVKLKSKVMGEERTILVSLPDRYAQTTARYPVLYMTDGDAHLLHTRGTVDFLARNGEMPDVIVVGIVNTDRTRDLTPTRGFRRLPDGTRQEVAGSGGGARFLDFFARELIPYVDANYRTTPYRILAGHSLGGLFTLYAFWERSELFSAHIAASPSLDWDDDLPLRAVEEFLKGKKELPRTVFVTMADEEAGDPAPTLFDRLRTVLGGAKPAGFAWDGKLMPEENHGSVVLRSHYWGLRAIFAGWRLPLEGRGRYAGTVDDLKAHYAGLATRFGVATMPSEALVNQLGYQHLLGGDGDGAMPFFRYNVELYPAAANVHDSLGEALEKAGRLEEAVASYARAVKNAKANADPRLDIFTRNHDRAAAALAKAKAKT